MEHQVGNPIVVGEDKPLLVHPIGTPTLEQQIDHLCTELNVGIKLFLSQRAIGSFSVTMLEREFLRYLEPLHQLLQHEYKCYTDESIDAVPNLPLSQVQSSTTQMMDAPAPFPLTTTAAPAASSVWYENTIPSTADPRYRSPTRNEIPATADPRYRSPTMNEIPATAAPRYRSPTRNEIPPTAPPRYRSHTGASPHYGVVAIHTPKRKRLRRSTKKAKTK